MIPINYTAPLHWAQEILSLLQDEPRTAYAVYRRGGPSTLPALQKFLDELLQRGWIANQERPHKTRPWKMVSEYHITPRGMTALELLKGD